MENIKVVDLASYLIARKDKKSYAEKIASLPESTKRNKEYAVKMFERFAQEKFKKSSNEVINEIIRIRKEESEEYTICLKHT